MLPGREILIMKFEYWFCENNLVYYVKIIVYTIFQKEKRLKLRIKSTNMTIRTSFLNY